MQPQALKVQPQDWYLILRKIIIDKKIVAKLEKVQIFHADM